jgi:hypothetical protein
MKRLLKRMLKALWHKTAPLRRPIMNRVDQRINVIFQKHIETNLTSSLQRYETAHNCLMYEVNLVLNSVVREQARLQMEVETIQQMIEESFTHRNGLSIVGEPHEQSLFAKRADEHAQVG